MVGTRRMRTMRRNKGEYLNIASHKKDITINDRVCMRTASSRGAFSGGFLIVWNSIKDTSRYCKNVDNYGKGRIYLLCLEVSI